MALMNSLKNFFKNNFDKILVLSALTLNGDNLLIVYFVIIFLILYMINKHKNLITSSLSEKFFPEGNIVQENNIEVNEIPKNIIIEEKSRNISSIQTPKKNIKTTISNKKLKWNPYENDSEMLSTKYGNNEPSDFTININNMVLSTPMFQLRTLDNLDYYWNFYVPGMDATKWSNIIMVSDLHKWMNSCNISNEDLPDQCMPILFITKAKETGLVEINEYLKCFIKTDSEGTKNVFVQMGNEYLLIKDTINSLKSQGLIDDLLKDNDFYNYNLNNNKNLCEFLEKFLTLVLIPKEFIGEQIKIDIGYNCENLNTYEYFFNSIVGDSNVFQTSI